MGVAGYDYFLIRDTETAANTSAFRLEPSLASEALPAASSPVLARGGFAPPLGNLSFVCRRARRSKTSTIHQKLLGGRRLQGSTVGGLGRGLDVPSKNFR